VSKSITIKTEDQQRPVMLRVWQLVSEMIKGGPVTVSVQRPSRSAEMNKKFHAMIRDIAQQVTFFGKRRYDTEVWKALLVDQFEQEKAAMCEPLSHPGQLITSMDGQRTITVRPSTTKFRKAEASEFIEFLYQQGSEMGVNWSEPALAVYAEYREAQEGRKAA
jgi:hypothetical protein